MSKDLPENQKKNQKNDLARAMARGTPVRVWAAKNGVPARTAQRWSHLPEVESKMHSVRRRRIDRAVGRLATGAVSAAAGIIALAKGAASESVKLSAQRAVLKDLMTVTDFNSFELRMTRIEEQLRARQTSMLGPR